VLLALPAESTVCLRCLYLSAILQLKSAIENYEDQRLSVATDDYKKSSGQRKSASAS